VSETKEVPRELKSEAEELRRQLFQKSQILRPTHLSLWRRSLLFFLLIGAIAGATILLIFEEPRVQMLAAVTEGWMRTYSDPEEGIFPLPPPAPKEVEPRVRYPDTFSSSESEFDGVLYSSSSPTVGNDEEESEEEPGFVNPAKTEESLEAFRFLIENSETARALEEDGLTGYQLNEWQPVRVDPPLFFIDLLVTRASDNRELHLVWEVDLETASIRALSQAARDLEAERKAEGEQ
jgi:hypothetical protein